MSALICEECGYERPEPGEDAASRCPECGELSQGIPAPAPLVAVLFDNLWTPVIWIGVWVIACWFTAHFGREMPRHGSVRAAVQMTLLLTSGALLLVSLGVAANAALVKPGRWAQAHPRQARVRARAVLTVASWAAFAVIYPIAMVVAAWPFSR